MENKKIHPLFGQSWHEDGLGGHYDEKGNKIVDFEDGSDADFDTYAAEVMNGDGYYDSSGKFHRFL